MSLQYTKIITDVHNPVCNEKEGVIAQPFVPLHIGLTLFP